MFCPHCGAEYRERFIDCPECHVPSPDFHPEPETRPDSSTVERERAAEVDLDTLIQTGFADPIAIGLARSLLQEAGIRFFAMDQNPAARQESGNFLGLWSVRVPQQREAEAREILRSVEEMK